ncbi:hypothetical protein K8R33_04730 [archaeon]|nr:hypothetical protein [archaeon]
MAFKQSIEEAKIMDLPERALSNFKEETEAMLCTWSTPRLESYVLGGERCLGIMPNTLKLRNPAYVARIREFTQVVDERYAAEEKRLSEKKGRLSYKLAQ